MLIMIIYYKCDRWFSYQALYDKMANAASLSIRAASRSLPLGSVIPARTDDATFSMVIWAK